MYIIRVMCKKWIILLVLSLTFQLNWTAASAFCQHETDKSTQHFGHHPHQHHTADQEDQKNKTGNKKPVSHPDCTTCHHGASMTADAQVCPFDDLGRQDSRSLTQLQLPIPFLAEPERPKWMRVV